MDFSWLKALAPTVASALGGPAAGLAVAAISKAFGIDADKVSDVLQAGQLTGEQILELKKAELELQQQEKELGFKFADIEVQDRKDARAMQNTTRSLVPPALSIGVTLGYFGVLIGMMTGELKATDSQVLLIMLGSLTTAWGTVLAFWFGTTHSSAQKTDIIARQGAAP